MTPLDLTDRPALTNWIAGVYLHTLEVLLLAGDLLSPAPRFTRDEARAKLDLCKGAIAMLFDRVDAILHERGVRGPLRHPTPEEMAKHDVDAKARWEAEQARLPLHQRRTLEQAEADEEAEMGRKLRRSRKQGGP